MSIKSKIALAIIGFFVPIALLTYFFVSARKEKISFAEKELVGSAYLRPLISLLNATIQFRVQSEAKAGTADAATAIQTALRDFETIEKQYHDQLPLDDKVISIRSAVSKLSSEASSAEAIAEIRATIAVVGDKSNLILDPDLDSFYVMDAVLLKLVEVMDQIHQGYVLAELVHTKQAITPEQKTQSVVILSTLATNIAGTISDIDIAQKNNPLGNVKTNLSSIITGYKTVAEGFTSGLEAMGKSDLEALAGAEKVLANYATLHKSTVEHWNRSTKEMDILLQERAHGAQNEMYINLAIVIVVLIGTLLFTLAIVRSIISSLNDLITIAQTASKGNLNVKANTQGANEITDLALALNIMIERIRTMIEELDTREYLEQSTNTLLQSMDEFANGNLTVRLHSDNNDAIGKLFRGFSNAVQDLESMVQTIQASVHATSSSTREMTVSMERMASGAEEQSVQVDLITESLRNMIQLIETNSTATAQASNAARSAGEIAQNGGKVIDATVHSIERITEIVQRSAKTVEELGQRSSEIGEIVSVINEIADQTNH